MDWTPSVERYQRDDERYVCESLVYENKFEMQWLCLYYFISTYNKNGVIYGEELLGYVSPMTQFKTCLFYKLQRVNELNIDNKTSLDHHLSICIQSH